MRKRIKSVVNYSKLYLYEGGGGGSQATFREVNCIYDGHYNLIRIECLGKWQGALTCSC